MVWHFSRIEEGLTLLMRALLALYPGRPPFSSINPTPPQSPSSSLDAAFVAAPRGHHCTWRFVRDGHQMDRDRTRDVVAGWRELRSTAWDMFSEMDC
jgi:hypothetical protein